jgi:hypothetical protein
VLRAVKAQDPERARQAMRHHMERAYKRFSVSWLKSTEPNREPNPSVQPASASGTGKPKRSAKTAKPGKIAG